MAVTEHRYIAIDNKVITLANVRALANELHSIYKRKGRGKPKKFKIEVYCSEKVVFTSAEPQIFADDSPITSKRVVLIEIGLYLEPSEAVEVKLMHNPSKPYENQISVVGDNSNWVNGTLKRLEEIVDTFSPQNTTIRRYSKSLAVILAFTIGLAFMNMISWMISWLAPSPPNIILSKQALEMLHYFKIPITMALFLAKYALALSFGSSPAANITARMVSLFPAVELQIGPKHKLTEKRRREQIGKLISVTGIVSLLLQVVYDVVSNLF